MAFLSKDNLDSINTMKHGECIQPDRPHSSNFECQLVSGRVMQ